MIYKSPGRRVSILGVNSSVNRGGGSGAREAGRLRRAINDDRLRRRRRAAVHQRETRADGDGATPRAGRPATWAGPDDGVNHARKRYQSGRAGRTRPIYGPYTGRSKALRVPRPSRAAPAGRVRMPPLLPCWCGDGGRGGRLTRASERRRRRWRAQRRFSIESRSARLGNESLLAIILTELSVRARVLRDPGSRKTFTRWLSAAVPFPPERQRHITLLRIYRDGSGRRTLCREEASAVPEVSRDFRSWLGTGI